MAPKVILYGEVVEMYLATFKRGVFLEAIRAQVRMGRRLSPEAYRQVKNHGGGRKAAKEFEPYVVQEEVKPLSKAATN